MSFCTWENTVTEDDHTAHPQQNDHRKRSHQMSKTVSRADQFSHLFISCDHNGHLSPFGFYIFSCKHFPSLRKWNMQKHRQLGMDCTLTKYIWSQGEPNRWSLPFNILKQPTSTGFFCFGRATTAFPGHQISPFLYFVMVNCWWCKPQLRHIINLNWSLVFLKNTQQLKLFQPKANEMSSARNSQK